MSFSGAGLQVTIFSLLLVLGLCRWAAYYLHYIFFVGLSYYADTTYNMYENVNLTIRYTLSSEAYFAPSIIRNLIYISYIYIFAYSPNGYHKLSCDDQGSNLQPPDERTGTLTTELIRLACPIYHAGYDTSNMFQRGIFPGNFPLQPPRTGFTGIISTG